MTAIAPVLNVPGPGHRVVELTENETVRDLGFDNADVGYLEELAKTYKGLQIRRQGAGVTICFSGLCGVLALPSRAVVVVTPKVPLAVFNLLAWHTKCPELLEPVKYEGKHCIHVLLLRALAKSIAGLLRQGLLQDFRTQREVLSKLRGRMDLSGELKQLSSGQWHRLACEYDDLTFDCLENRVIRMAAEAGASLLPKELPGVGRVSRELAAIAHELKSMGISDEPLELADLRPIEFTRLNQHYRYPIQLAKMVIADAAVQLKAAARTADWRVLPGALIDTAALFETAVAEGIKWAMQRWWPDVGVEIQRSDWLMCASSGYSRRCGTYFAVRPDVQLERQGKVVAVLDTKYKELALPSQLARQADLETEEQVSDDGALWLQREKVSSLRADTSQVLAYCLARGARRAVLVHPAYEPSAPPVAVAGTAWTRRGDPFPRIQLWWVRCNCAASGSSGRYPLEPLWEELAAKLVELTCGG